MIYNLLNSAFLVKNIYLETQVLLKLTDQASLYMNQTVETFTYMQS